MIYHLQEIVNIRRLTQVADHDMMRSMKGLLPRQTGKGDCLMTVREVLAA